MECDAASLFFLLTAGFFCGAAGALLISRRGGRWGLIDVPNLRSSHSNSTPRGGGFGIVAAIAAGGILLARPLWFWGIPAVLGLVGFFDDRLNLSAWTRLGFHLVAAGAWVLLFWSGGDFTLQKTLIAVFCMVFIAGSANFFNFMDGIDGMAGISGAVGFSLLALFGFSHSLTNQALFCLAVASACLGFLPFNFPRARVFMGDVGSIPLGFVFGALVFDMAGGLGDFLCLVSFLFPFYADAGSTLFIRWRNGERLSQAHRKHLYQLLVNELNHTHAAVSVAYGGLQLLIGLLAFIVRQSGPIWQLSFLLLLIGGFLPTTYKVRRSAPCQFEGAR